MNIKMTNGSNIKKVAIGTVAAIGICALSFSAMTNLAKAAVVNKTEVIPTTYSATVSNANESKVPSGYAKADYKVKISEYSSKPTEKDMSAEAAAELGAQDIWKLFKPDMSGKTIQMCYNAVTTTQPRAQWEGVITVDKNLNYWFSVDAITGEYQTTGQNKYWSNTNADFDKALAKKTEQYTSLAKDVAEKYQLVSGKVVSSEYDGQGYSASSDLSAKNPEIFIMVTSENGQQAQLIFSRYNQEFLQVSYDSSVKDMKSQEEKIEKELAEKEKTQKQKENTENFTPMLITQEDINNKK